MFYKYTSENFIVKIFNMRYGRDNEVTQTYVCEYFILEWTQY